MLKKIVLHKKKYFLIFTFCVAFICFLFCLPRPLFKDSYSIIVNDADGNLLSAKIANDGQWRFPLKQITNEKLSQSVLAFEDEYFYYHIGINPASIYRAIKQNSKAKKVVSGGSTITMQLARLIRKNKPRTYYEKIIEIIYALRLELTYSKKEILSLYCSHAPFGGNVVGVEAASWRYFGRSHTNLSWAESATLAILPNSPSLIYPGKNQEKLRKKRNALLFKLFQLKKIEEDDYYLALQEPLPSKPFPLPNKARHLLNRLAKENVSDYEFNTTIQSNIHNKTLDIVTKHAMQLKHNGIHNLACLVIDVRTNNIVSYIGNTPLKDTEPHGEAVDVITANRSTGSLLKPYLYNCMLHDGELLPNMLVPDIPTQIAGYVPQNFDFTYDGAVPAKQALARSLNIPAVKLLQQYSIEKFLDRLHQLGLKSMNRSADNYGLSLILGGGEATLWEMCAAYSSMAKVLNRFNMSTKYDSDDWKKPSLLIKQNEAFAKTNSDFLSASSIWLTFDAMAEVSRPDVDASWRRLGNAQKIAWKTGTSFGFRDGWAIGVSSKYVIGIWVGNADGEGRTGLTGISTAAPILFEVFGILQSAEWFKKPISDMKKVVTCLQSGCLASPNCVQTKTEFIPKNANVSIVCKYHQLIHVDELEQYRVTDACVSPLDMKTISWFQLPPVQEYYYKLKNPTYKTLLPYKIGCAPSIEKTMEMIYPKAGTVIYIPYELNGEQGKTIFEVAHRFPANHVFWHIDGNLVGETSDIHQLAVSIDKGKHLLSIADNSGETITIPFEVVSEKRK